MARFIRKVGFCFLFLFLPLRLLAQHCPPGWDIYSQTRDTANGLHQVACLDSITGQVTWDGTFINTSSGNQLISGGQIFWTGTGFQYIVSAASYVIAGQVYSSPQTNITLPASDPTNPRIDTIAVNSSAQVLDIEGTPAPSPSQPSVDPTTQISLGFILVPAASSQPSGVSNNDVYLENAGPPNEWACSANGASWDCADTSYPFQGTYDVSTTGASSTDYVSFAPASSLDPTSYSTLNFELETTVNWSSQDALWIGFYSGSSLIGNAIEVTSGNYGWDGLASGYELVSIPVTTFSTLGSQITSLRIWFAKGSNPAKIALHVDNVILQSGASGGSGSGSGSSTGVTSVAMQGDGIVFQPAVAGSPVTTSGTLLPALASVPPGYVLAGPVPALGSNVGVRQEKVCATDGSASQSCTFDNPVAAGSVVVAYVQEDHSGYDDLTSATDSLQTSYTYVGLSSAAAVYGTATKGGADTLTLAFNYPASTSNIVMIELVGTGAFIGHSGCNFVVSSSSCSTSLTPNAATDGVIEFAGVVGSSYPTNEYSVSPKASLVDAWSSNSLTGTVWAYGPGNTSLQTLIFNGPTLGLAQEGVMNALDFNESANSGSAPWVARKLTEGDLPATAINAVQSVQTFVMSAASITVTGVNTANTIITGTVTMPSQGCPCRILTSYSLYWSESAGSVGDAWVSDGDGHAWDSAERKTQSGGGGGFAATEMSTVSYADSQSVTLTLSMASNVDSSIVVSKIPVNSIDPVDSEMTLSIVQSMN